MRILNGQIISSIIQVIHFHFVENHIEYFLTLLYNDISSVAVLSHVWKHSRMKLRTVSMVVVAKTESIAIEIGLELKLLHLRWIYVLPQIFYSICLSHHLVHELCIVVLYVGNFLENFCVDFNCKVMKHFQTEVVLARWDVCWSLIVHVNALLVLTIITWVIRNQILHNL